MMTPESKLQIKCVRTFYRLYPQAWGRLFMNYNNPRSARNGRILVSMGLTAGVADLTLLSDEGPIFIELKSGKNQQNENQKSWQKQIESAGYRYHLIRSEWEFFELITSVMKGVITYPGGDLNFGSKG
jgi:hypothetical protein